jgi:hypothetical protein
LGFNDGQSIGVVPKPLDLKILAVGDDGALE